MHKPVFVKDTQNLRHFYKVLYFLQILHTVFGFTRAIRRLKNGRAAGADGITAVRF